MTSIIPQEWLTGDTIPDPSEVKEFIETFIYIKYNDRDLIIDYLKFMTDPEIYNNNNNKNKYCCKSPFKIIMLQAFFKIFSLNFEYLINNVLFIDIIIKTFDKICQESFNKYPRDNDIIKIIDDYSWIKKIHADNEELNKLCICGTKICDHIDTCYNCSQYNQILQFYKLINSFDPNIEEFKQLFYIDKFNNFWPIHLNNNINNYPKTDIRSNKLIAMKRCDCGDFICKFETICQKCNKSFIEQNNKIIIYIKNIIIPKIIKKYKESDQFIKLNDIILNESKEDILNLKNINKKIEYLLNNSSIIINI